ncbi:MAG TPA: M14 family zinc carboxypeptidase [Planctomycetota bacterium]|nr:M14 family zinc carboxypeptidase [Planctomycetota bacterium]
MRITFSRGALLVFAAAALLTGCQQPMPASPSRAPRVPAPSTIPEQTRDARTCSHAELMEFLDALSAAGDPRLVRTTFGTTPEGRALPLVIVADPPVATPQEAFASGKPRVFVMANIHAGEVEGKEACLELLREIVFGAARGGAAGDEPCPVRDLVLLVAPIYNADGNDRFGPTNRPLQNGPPLTGTRATAGGKDLNRDYLKLETAEAAALVALLAAWDPHVVVDLHTTNGSSHGYELTYAGPLSPSTDGTLRAALEQDWLPELRRRVRERHGFELFDYGNFIHAFDESEVDVPDTVTGWRTFDHRPRFGNNYVGLRNRFAILSEAYSYADFRVRIAATRAFVAEILRLAAERGADLMAVCARADAATAAAGRDGQLLQATGAELVSRGTEPLRLRGTELRKDPGTGEVTKVAAGPVTLLDVPCFTGFRATATCLAPRAYILPPSQAALADRLAVHGLRVETLAAPLTATVSVCRVAETSLAEEVFQGHHARGVRWSVSEQSRTFPAGSLRIGLDQPLARLAFQILDPQADDGLLVWNTFDDVIASGPGAELPVYAVR